jgi:hypothetical protein
MLQPSDEPGVGHAVTACITDTFYIKIIRKRGEKNAEDQAQPCEALSLTTTLVTLQNLQGTRGVNQRHSQRGRFRGSAHTTRQNIVAQPASAPGLGSPGYSLILHS